MSEQNNFLDLESLFNDSNVPNLSLNLPDIDDLLDGLDDKSVQESMAGIDAVSAIDLTASTFQDTFGLSTLVSRTTMSYNTVVNDPLDIDGYEYILSKSQTLQDVKALGEAEMQVFPYLMQDIFLSLFKYKPTFYPPQQLASSVKINSMIMQQLVDTPEWRQMKYLCRLDDIKSALGTEALAHHALKIIQDLKKQYANQAPQNGQAPKDPFDTMNDMYTQEQLTRKFSDEELAAIMQGVNDPQMGQQVQQAIQQGMSNIQAGLGMPQGGMGSLMPPQIDPNVVAASNAGMNALQAAQIADALDNDLMTDMVYDDIMDDLEDMTSPSSDEGYKEAMTQIHETSQFIENWGFGDGGSNGTTRIPFENKRAALEKIRQSKKLRKISDLLGRLKTIARFEQKRKSKDGAHAIKSVELGANLESVLPSEKLLLSNPTTKMLFYQKMTEKQLLQYSKTSKRTKHKGPMIICGDESGSMHGSNEIWLKAVILTFLEIAQLQKRDFAYIPFASNVGRIKVITKGQFDPLSAINIAEEFMNGGTDFQSPLSAALDLLEKSEFKKADIVMITDGDAGIGDSFMKRFNKLKETKEFKLQTIIVDASHNTKTSLDPISDSVMLLSEMSDLTEADPSLAHQLFGSV